MNRKKLFRKKGKTNRKRFPRYKAWVRFGCGLYLHWKVVDDVINNLLV